MSELSSTQNDCDRLIDETSSKWGIAPVHFFKPNITHDHSRRLPYFWEEYDANADCLKVKKKYLDRSFSDSFQDFHDVKDALKSCFVILPMALYLKTLFLFKVFFYIWLSLRCLTHWDIESSLTSIAEIPIVLLTGLYVVMRGVGETIKTLCWIGCRLASTGCHLGKTCVSGNGIEQETIDTGDKDTDAFRCHP